MIRSDSLARLALHQNMKRTIKDWLIVLASLSDDAAGAVLVLLLLWVFGIPVSLPIIIFIVLFFVASAFAMHKLITPALHRKITTGAEGMIGLEGKVVRPPIRDGLVRVEGEYWKARWVGEDTKDIKVGEDVEITRLDGLTLIVKRKRRTVL
jgi:membrane-bound ClpP family serine protease